MSRSLGATTFGAGPDALLDMACRVATEGQKLPQEITAAAREVAPEIVTLPPARVRSALESVIMGNHLSDGLQWLHDSGVLGKILPELDATVDFSQEAGRRHKDVWE